MKFALIGSISHGTLRNEDLLEALSSELEWNIRRNPDMASGSKLVDEAAAMLMADADEGSEWEEQASDLVNQLCDALNDFAPPYCYFGAHGGDGSDFGFWPDMESIEELPRVEGSDEARELGEDCLFVNDHGNCTVFSGAGEEVISIV